MARVDCRRCKYFVRLDELDDDLREKIMYQRGRRALGYCKLQKFAIIRYKGYCSHFERKEDQVKPLDHYIPITIKVIE